MTVVYTVSDRPNNPEIDCEKSCSIIDENINKHTKNKAMIVAKQTDQQTDTLTNIQTDNHIDTSTDDLKSEPTTNSQDSEEKSIIIFTPENPDESPLTKQQITELTANQPGSAMAPPALSEMTFSEQIRYLDSILLQLDPKYSPPELSPVHPLYTTVIKPPDEMEQVIRNYETRKRKRQGSASCRGSAQCRDCRKQDGVVIRYSSNGGEKWGKEKEGCKESEKRKTCRNVSYEENSLPTSTGSTEIEGKLRELRIEHCTKLREFCEKRAVLEEQSRPEKKRRSLRKRLSNTVRSLALFRSTDRGDKSSEEKNRTRVRSSTSVSSPSRVSLIAENIL